MISHTTLLTDTKPPLSVSEKEMKTRVPGWPSGKNILQSVVFLYTTANLNCGVEFLNEDFPWQNILIIMFRCLPGIKCDFIV